MIKKKRKKACFAPFVVVFNWLMCEVIMTRHYAPLCESDFFMKVSLLISHEVLMKQTKSAKRTFITPVNVNILKSWKHPKSWPIKILPMTAIPFITYDHFLCKIRNPQGLPFPLIEKDWISKLSLSSVKIKQEVCAFVCGSSALILPTSVMIDWLSVTTVLCWVGNGLERPR